MALRHGIAWQLRIPPLGGRALLRESMSDQWRNRFMLGRLDPYEGWQDRMSGHYWMNHNRHIDPSVLQQRSPEPT